MKIMAFSAITLVSRSNYRAGAANPWSGSRKLATADTAIWDSCSNHSPATATAASHYTAAEAIRQFPDRASWWPGEIGHKHDQRA